jgi:Escherichia/Staphylococcus phage prohead protease
VDALAMELRDVRESERLLIGVVAPYDELTYLAPDPMGERIVCGAFARSIDHRGDKIPILRAHDRSKRMGRSRSFVESREGLVGHFEINPGDEGDLFLAQCRDGYYGGLSAGFVPMGRPERAPDGARLVREAKLVEVSAVGVPAYEGAGLLAVREAQDLDALLAPFRARPDVNLAPLPPLAYRPR